jgi:hypothetical protein
MKTNYTKYISLKLFYSHQLQESREISILKTKSCDNYADLFTNSLPLATFDKCVKDIACVDLRICNIQWERLSEQGSVIRHYICTLFPLCVFICCYKKVFNEIICTQDDVYLSIFFI